MRELFEFDKIIMILQFLIIISNKLFCDRDYYNVIIRLFSLI